MKRLIILVSLLLFTGVGVAVAGSNPCPPGHQNIGSCNGDNGDNGGNTFIQGQNQGQAQGQAQFTNVNNVSESNAAALAVSGDSRAEATGGSATIGDIAIVSDARATGGQGGSSVAVVERGAVELNYEEVRQAPSIGQGSFAIQGCGVAGNAGGSNSTGAVFLGLGWTPAQCYDFMLAQAYQSVGERKTACEVLNNTKAGKRAKKNGVIMPNCDQPVVAPVVSAAPESKTIIVPVVYSEKDTTEYVTKEELNRAFKAAVAK